MPLTSLAAQLKKLETPQTSLLFHKKTRPSFLFDAKEAAEFDRDTFYDLGLSGLEELKKLNPRFSDFEDTLFDITSKSFERAVETQETNKKLDSRIREFLALLSPYFLLRSAHKALEWLIHRYHVEQYNVADLLCLGLPYHETNTFGRLLGLLEIGDNDPAWLWLVPVRRASVPLSKTALLNRAATDMAFFRFVANMPDNAIKIHGKSASSLGTLFCFYCTTLLGALEYSSRVTELHVSHLLPSIMAALADRNLPDYTASAYIILARLMTKIQLAEKVVHGLYNKISKVEHAKLCSESVLMLVLMTQNDSSRASLPERAVKRIATVTSSPNGGWFVPTLVTLVETSVGLVVTPLVCGLLRTVLKMVQSGTDNLEELKRFVHDLLLGDLRFDDEDFEQVFRLVHALCLY
ncbi:hypothetical protein AAG570_014105 [Ranatra chinensis]|uniref:HEAT repeat-containing protein 1 n=1 Tax=Ranatra chinensis TaxID=642074 RepID=A0ABD0Y7D9_9HEMI